MDRQTSSARSLVGLRRRVVRRLRSLSDPGDAPESRTLHERILLLRRHRILTSSFAAGLESFLSSSATAATATKRSSLRRQLEDGQFFLGLLEATARARSAKHR